MIVIVDNGGQYSDHAMCFVDIGEGHGADDRLEVMKDMVIFTTWDTEAFLLGVVDPIGWREIPSSAPLWLKPATWEGFVFDWNVHRPPCAYVAARKEWDQIKFQVPHEERRKRFPDRDICDCGISQVGAVCDEGGGDG